MNNDDWLELLERERNSHYSHLLRLKPRNNPTVPHVIDHRAIEYFERNQASISPDPDNSEPINGDPTEFQFNVLKLLPENLRISEMARRYETSFWFVSNALRQLEKISLVTRRANRRHWPTEKGFTLIGLDYSPPPTHPRKAGQSIYFGKNPPPKPKAQLPSHVSITETNEGYFIKVNDTILDVPFDSVELARRGAEAWLATKPNSKGMADYYRRKRAALFQFIGDEANA